jgi:succinyl-diaminopimelate desuccinylase
MTTEELIPKIEAFVKIPSTASNPQALQQAVDFMASFIQEHAAVTIERFEKNGKPSLLAYRHGDRPKRFDILLNAHVDVVPGKKEQFSSVVKDGRLYGRGAFDMKTAALVETLVFCEMANRVPYALGLQIVSDEEVGGYDGVKYQLDQGVRADFVLTGEHALEPGTIYTEQRGIAWIEVAFRGQTAHGGYPWNGNNALIQASTFAHKVLERYPLPRSKIWGTTANIASIETTNKTHNRVPEDALIKIDFRFTREDPVFHTIESLKQFVHSLDPMAEIKNIPVFDLAMTVDESNPRLQALMRAVGKETHQPARLDRRYAGGDARHYAALGDAAVEFGLTGSDMHGNDECVELTAIPTYAIILTTFLNNVTLQFEEERSQSQTQIFHTSTLTPTL